MIYLVPTHLERKRKRARENQRRLRQRVKVQIFGLEQEVSRLRAAHDGDTKMLAANQRRVEELENESPRMRSPLDISEFPTNMLPCTLGGQQLSEAAVASIAYPTHQQESGPSTARPDSSTPSVAASHLSFPSFPHQGSGPQQPQHTQYQQQTASLAAVQSRSSAGTLSQMRSLVPHSADTISLGSSASHTEVDSLSIPRMHTWPADTQFCGAQSGAGVVPAERPESFVSSAGGHMFTYSQNISSPTTFIDPAQSALPASAFSIPNSGAATSVSVPQGPLAPQPVATGVNSQFAFSNVGLNEQSSSANFQPSSYWPHVTQYGMPPGSDQLCSTWSPTGPLMMPGIANIPPLSDNYSVPCQEASTPPWNQQRRRPDEIERAYKCGWNGCENAYGMLKHLNAHVTMQSHGPRRKQEEFQGLRKQQQATRRLARQAERSALASQATFPSNLDYQNRYHSTGPMEGSSMSIGESYPMPLSVSYPPTNEALSTDTVSTVHSGYTPNMPSSILGQSFYGTNEYGNIVMCKDSLRLPEDRYKA